MRISNGSIRPNGLLTIGKLSTLIMVCLITGGALSAKAKPRSAPEVSHSGQAFHKGNLFLGGGIGLGSGLGFLGGFAFIANAEYAVTNEIGVGASAGYWSYSSESYSYTYATSTAPFTATGTYKYTYSIIPIIVSGAYHFHIPSMPKLDLAAGLSLGYYIVNATAEASGGNTTGLASASASGVAWGVFGVARYFVTERVGLRGKLGYGITVVEVGVDFRI